MIKKLLSCLTICILVLISIGGMIGWQSMQFWLRSPAVKPADCTEEICTAFSVQSGESIRSVAERLKNEDLIRNRFWFLVFVKIDQTARGIQAGNFLLPAGMNYSGLMDILSNAKSEEVSVTIPEGLTIAQIGVILVEHFSFTEDEWMAVAKGKEGHVFPSTYRFLPNATAEQVLARLESEMTRRINLMEPDYTKLGGHVKNEEQLLIVASIIEREVRKPEEMSAVADIIYKRLAIGMPLQMDSTVNYVTGNKTPSITLKDREIDSPYNTYKYAGLPPAPISNPGENAIRAALNPMKNDYYYFLTSPDGTVYYGKTFEEHIANRIYLR